MKADQILGNVNQVCQRLGGTSGRVIEPRNCKVEKIYRDFEKLKKLDTDYEKTPEGPEKSEKRKLIRDHLRNLSSDLAAMQRNIKDDSLFRDIIDSNDKQALKVIGRKSFEIFDKYQLIKEKPIASQKPTS